MSISYKSKVSQKGWVVIPAKLRKQFGINPGSEINLVEEGDHLLIYPAMADPIIETSGKYAGKTSLAKTLLKERKIDLKLERK